MNRNRAFVFVVALLCVAGLAVAAATVDAPAASQEETGSDTGNGTDDEVNTVTAEPAETTSDGPGFEVPPFFRWIALAIFVVALVVSLAIAAKRMDREDAKLLAVFAVVVVVVGLAALSVLGPPTVPSQNQTTIEEQNESGSPGGDAGRDVEEDPKQELDVPIVLLGVFGLLTLGLLAAIARLSGSERSTPTVVGAEPTAQPDDERVGAVGEAAGRAADRMAAAGVDTDNAVYDAWREMTDALEVENPATTTPAEFADAAVAAGMAREDVSELTWLFEEVRYGDQPVTDERERRATEALRRIESAYATEDGDE